MHEGKCYSQIYRTNLNDMAFDMANNFLLSLFWFLLHYDILFYSSNSHLFIFLCSFVFFSNVPCYFCMLSPYHLLVLFILSRPCITIFHLSSGIPLTKLKKLLCRTIVQQVLIWRKQIASCFDSANHR